MLFLPNHFLLLLAFFLPFISSAKSDDAPSVILPSNGMKLVGTAEEGSGQMVYRGIPYAQPPVNGLRWQPPQDYVPTTDEMRAGRSAEEFGAICIQPVGATPMEPIYAGEEDCLFLNVYIPTKSESSELPLPVAVWIHGGSYVSGSGSLYNGTALSSFRNDIITVTINYRLNIFGFLGSKELGATVEDGGTGNFGILDQRLALKWVRENIAAFGGDSSHINIFGESAGAGSVSSHLLMRGSAPYFDAAVMESGGFSLWNSQPLSIAQSTFDSVLDVSGCQNVECLLALGTKELTKACADATMAIFDVQAPISTPSGWAPTVDGVELTDHPWNLLEKGEVNFNDVDVIIGTNRDEGAMFTSVTTNGTNEELIEYWTTGPWTDEEVAKMTEIYLVENEGTYPSVEGYSTAWWASVRSLGDLSFTCPTQHAAPYVTAADSGTFVYHFEHVNSANVAVSHGDEVPYVFHDYDRILGADKEDKATCDVVASMWLDFFVVGNPNGGGEGEVWSPGAENVLLIEGADNMSTAAQGWKDSECEFWHDTMARIVNENF
ncbi:hypothetical protein TrST_g4374 [Triparma strigata]|uniref:Carboxylic ester hydrolase n=2 Tax=Triparma strigata TaxID=1606541 RepID=A0A9W7E741_9STRA|nr:hypothetical protein TrST_g4374 [Triparma strigata]